jgi:hypothetical protein
VPEELVTTACPCSDEVLGFLRATTALYAEQDVDGVAELFTPDVVFADHRPLGTNDSNGREEMKTFLRLTYETLPDFKISVLVLDQRHNTYLARDTYAGHAAEGGGEAVIEWWVVDTLREGRLAREDIYATEDEARAEFEKRTVHPPS